MFISKSFSFNRPSLLPRPASPNGAIGAGFTGARAWLQRWVGAFNRRPVAGGALEHLATLPLSAQPSLVLVRLGQQTLLLGATAQNISLLAKISAELPDISHPINETMEHEETRQ